MSQSQFREPGDVIIKSVVLMDKEQRKNLNRLQGKLQKLDSQVVSINIYEDMQCPVLFCTVELLDAINIVQSFPIVGEEFIGITIQTPGLPSPVEYFFAVTSISQGKTGEASQYQTYTLTCVSEEQLASAAKMTQYAAEGSYSDLVKQIMERDLETKKPFYIEPTRGLMGNVIPKLKPLAAIDYMRQMAISQQSTTSAFVFFETQKGFQFRTIESLIAQNQKGYIKEFEYLTDVMSQKETSTRSFRNIIKYEVISRTDTVDKLQTGVLNNVSNGYDLITKSIRQTTHNIATDIKNFVTPDKKARAPVTQSLHQQFGQQPADTFFIPVDSSQGSIARDLTFAARRAYTALFNQNVIRVLIHGDTSLVPGELIDVALPEIKGTSSTKKQDSFNSGRYLVIRLRHMIIKDVKVKHTISADIVKIGFKA